MYYEEKLIAGKWHWRGSPNGEWKPMDEHRRATVRIKLRDALIAELERELRVAQDEVSDLRGFIDGMKPYIEAAAAMYGLGKGKGEGDSNG